TSSSSRQRREQGPHCRSDASYEAERPLSSAYVSYVSVMKQHVPLSSVFHFSSTSGRCSLCQRFCKGNGGFQYSCPHIVREAYLHKLLATDEGVQVPSAPRAPVQNCAFRLTTIHRQADWPSLSGVHGDWLCSFSWRRQRVICAR